MRWDGVVVLVEVILIRSAFLWPLKEATGAVVGFAPITASSND